MAIINHFVFKFNLYHHLDNPPIRYKFLINGCKFIINLPTYLSFHMGSTWVCGVDRIDLSINLFVITIFMVCTTF